MHSHPHLLLISDHERLRHDLQLKLFCANFATGRVPGRITLTYNLDEILIENESKVPISGFVSDVATRITKGAIVA